MAAAVRPNDGAAATSLALASRIAATSARIRAAAARRAAALSGPGMPARSIDAARARSAILRRLARRKTMTDVERSALYRASVEFDNLALRAAELVISRGAGAESAL